jgi:DNA processing protein
METNEPLPLQPPAELPRDGPLWARLDETPYPPETLWARGPVPDLSSIKVVAVVGSRNATDYGLEAARHLVSGLRGYPVAIASGLALGIDAAALQAAVEVGLPTLALPGSGLSDEALYPRTNLPLARRILRRGGCLLSEMAPEERAAPWCFPRRNRILAGIADAVVVVEAQRPSGTLITSKLALDYSREVLAVPGSIFSTRSDGANWLLSMGAAPARDANDILQAIGIEPRADESIGAPPPDLDPDAALVLASIGDSPSRDELLERLMWPAARLAIAITTLELYGLAEELRGRILLAQKKKFPPSEREPTD